jgi:hypothetical protein
MNGSSLAEPKVVEFVEKINQRIHDTHVMMVNCIKIKQFIININIKLFFEGYFSYRVL